MTKIGVDVVLREQVDRIDDMNRWGFLGSSSLKEAWSTIGNFVG